MTQKEALLQKNGCGKYCGGCIYYSEFNAPLKVQGFCYHKEGEFKNRLLHRDFSCILHKFPPQKEKKKKRKK